MVTKKVRLQKNGEIRCLVCNKLIKRTFLTDSVIFTVCEICRFPNEWQAYYETTPNLTRSLNYENRKSTFLN